jgi:uncharacterized Zn finger protein
MPHKFEADLISLQEGSMSLPTITESIIRAGAGAQSFERGQEYYRSGAISNTAIQGHTLTGECEGTQEPYYQVRVELDEAGIRSARCTCAYDYGGYCKHVVALLLHYVHYPNQFTIRQDPTKLLADLSRDELMALMTKLLRDRPEVYDWVEAAISMPAEANKANKVQRKKKVDAGVYRRQIRNILHSLDGMRASEAYWQVGGLVEQLGEVQATALKFLDAGEPETALQILLTLLEEAGGSIEYIDDSDGEMSGFVSELSQPLAEAILSLDLSAVEREKLADQLTRLAAHLGDYGMDDTIDLAIEAARYGWGSPPASRIDEDEWEEGAFEDEDEQGHDEWDYATPARGDLTEAKLNVLERQGRTEQYLALCQAAGRHLRYALKLCDLGRVPEAVTFANTNLASAEEAVEMAERLRALGHIAEALTIGEQGLKLGGSKRHLGEWLGPVEEAQGRLEQALQAWLAAFPEHPTLESYQTLKRLGASNWNQLRPEVMEKLRKSHDVQTLAEVLLYEEEWDEAIRVAEGRDVWYRVVETVVDAVMPHRAEWAAQVSLQHAERLMVEAKSKNYPLAVEWLKRVKKAYALLGKTGEWQAYLHGIKEQYKRRPALQAQLQCL